MITPSSLRRFYGQNRLAILAMVPVTIFSLIFLHAGLPVLADIMAITESPAPVFSTLIPDQAYVIQDNVNYKLYYAGNDFASINLAQSTDGVNWTPYVGNPVLAEGALVQGEHADVHYYSDGFTGANSGSNPSAATMYYRMWYQGAAAGIGGWRYSESTDGISWYNQMAVSQSGTPVFSAATGVDYGIADVVYTPGGEGGDPAKTFRIYANVQWEIGAYSAKELVVMAYSPNGYVWTGYDPTAAGYATPVFTGTLNAGDFDSDHIGWFKVIKNSDTNWEAFYSGGTGTTYQDLNGIGYATSTDGISWARRKTLFTTNDPVLWRAKSVWMPSVVKTGINTYKIWFLGSDNPNIGASDWIQWKVGEADLVRDITPPTVTATSPAAASTNISPGQGITATFSETMDPATLSTSTFTLKKGATPVAGTVSYSGLQATFIPNVTLDSDSTYSATVTTGAQDSAGNALTSDYTWDFTTGWNYHDWSDQGLNYTAPAAGDAYYPSVIYDTNGFGSATPQYNMWYTDGAGGAYLVSSPDGTTWGSPTTMTGIPNAHHVQVLYDANCFGTIPCNAGTNKYKIWFWDIGAPTIYSISSMATAESVDGINWTGKTAVTQDPSAKLIQDPDSGLGWNRGTYGPVNVFYQPSAGNSGTNPWNYKFVMYYNGTDGSHEDTGLAYSTDGLNWSAYTANPVLSGSNIGGSAAWDCGSATYGTIYRDNLGYHFFYSGRGEDDGSGGCAFPASFDGIGLASSADGITWTKDAKPIFQISDGIPYRAGRIYTPSVINDGSGLLRMYFSAKDSVGGPKKIGYATMTPPAFLHVIKNVINDNGGAATAAQFSLHVKQAGTDVSGSPAPGTAAPGTMYALPPAAFTVNEDYHSGYTSTISGNCDASGSITLIAGTDKTCTITNDDNAPSGGGGGGGGSSSSGGGGGGSAAFGKPASSGGVPVSGLHASATSQFFSEIPCDRNSTTSIPFTDNINQWSGSYIDTLFRQCIIDGKTTTLFKPDDYISRAELVKIAMRQSKLENTHFSKLFQDVNESDWFAAYVISAAKAGVVEGYINSSKILPFFRPDQYVTRAEALKILLKAKGITYFGNYGTRFADVGKNDWFYPYVTYLEKNGVLEGYSEISGPEGAAPGVSILTFRPNNFITREEASKVAVLVNAL